MTTFTTLLSAADLLARLQEATPPLVLDAGFDLADPAAGERAHAAAHLPDSLYVHLDRDLSGPKSGANGRHPLPERRTFAATAGRLGIAPATQVIALDRQGGVYAARLWWMLRWLGHEAVAVLDGGLRAWQAAGGPTSSTVAAPLPAPPYPERPPLVTLVDLDQVARRPPEVAVLDARAGERFRGEVEPLDRVAGHIPGALNRPYAGNLGPDGRFKPAAVLAAEFRAALGQRGAAEVIHSCGSGVTACHNLLAMEHAGLAGSRLYPGSWSEWSADPARPIARG